MNSQFYFAAIVGISAALSMNPSALANDHSQDTAKGECWGANACKGKGECGGKDHSCAGKNECKGKGWVSMTKAECAKAKGKFKG